VQAVQITAFGGPEVLRLTEVDEPVPDTGELLIDVYSAGVNYADTHQVENSYLAPQTLPMIPGSEVVGRIRHGSRAGQRVLAMLGNGGGYAETALAQSAHTYPLDDTLTDAQALALIVQGTTAWHLLRTCTHFSPGETVVIHSAAGGVGSIAVQLARAWGAGRIIGTASGAQKCALVESLGADVAIDLADAEDADDVKAMLRGANGGRPVDVVLEMTGGHVFDGSLSALRPLGRLAVFGMASRVAPSRIKIPALMASSRSVTGFWLAHALRLPGGLARPLEELTSMIRAGRLSPIIGGSYPLADAGEAHAELRTRRSIGKLILNVRADPDDPDQSVVATRNPATAAEPGAPPGRSATAASTAAATKSLISRAGALPTPAPQAAPGSARSAAAPEAVPVDAAVNDERSRDLDAQDLDPRGNHPKDHDPIGTDTGTDNVAEGALPAAADSAGPGHENAGPQSPGTADTDRDDPSPEDEAAKPSHPPELESTWAKAPTTEPTAAQLAAVESFGSAS
jgi:NADPH:quinone reductase